MNHEHPDRRLDSTHDCQASRGPARSAPTEDGRPTLDEIREAGRELDAEVAERVFGYYWHAWDDSGPFSYLLAPDDDGLGESSIARRRSGMLERSEYRGPCYSTDIDAAWTVVDAMERREPDPWMVELSNWHYYGRRWWRATFRSHPLGPRPIEVEAETAPLAICLAALAAVSAPSTTGSSTSD